MGSSEFKTGLRGLLVTVMGKYLYGLQRGFQRIFHLKKRIDTLCLGKNKAKF